jgi:hypothetical protein
LDINKILKESPDNNCQLCGNEMRTYFMKKNFCKSCKKQIHDNIMALLLEEEMTGSPALKATARRLYEANYSTLTS